VTHIMMQKSYYRLGWFPATTPELAKLVWADLYIGSPAAATANGPGRLRENGALAAGPAEPGELQRGCDGVGVSRPAAGS
jgi:hypothetical protein